MVGLNLLLNLLLIWTPLKEAGLAWSTAFCGMVQAMLLWLVLHRNTGGITSPLVLRSALRSLGATAAMAAVVWGTSLVFNEDPTWTQALLQLAVSVVAGIAVFAGTAAALRMKELHWAVGRSIESA